MKIAQSLHAEIRRAIGQTFINDPPHTIQRVAELLLQPKREYRFLPPYLQALNRSLSVTSGTKVFPLPSTTLGAQPATLGITINGTSDSGLGSDESLGGALLTPIPWLTRSIPQSPGADVDHTLRDTAFRLQEQFPIRDDEGYSDTEFQEHTLTGAGFTNGDASTLDAQLRSEGAVSQGELLRMEQLAGVVPVPARHQEGNAAWHEPEAHDSHISDESPEEQPHARGPEEIGAEDIGPQNGTGGVAGIVRSTGLKSPELDGNTKFVGLDDDHVKSEVSSKISQQSEAGDDALSDASSVTAQASVGDGSAMDVDGEGGVKDNP